MEASIQSQLRVAPQGTVVIVDDNHDLGDLYAAALEMVGIDVRIAHNEEAGWTAASVTEPDADLVLLDIDLGTSNGLDLLDRLRAHAWPRRPPLLVVFTNSDDPAHRSRALSSGADGYLVKADVRLRQFLVTVAALLDQRD